MLPFSVFAHKNESKLSEDNIIPGAPVRLLCPQCTRPHVFYSLHEAAKAPKAVRDRLFRK